MANALTPREREVLSLRQLGLKNKQVAERLGLSLCTVREHVRHLIHKGFDSPRLSGGRIKENPSTYFGEDAPKNMDEY